MKQAREAIRALPTKERDKLTWNGIGPGDSYIGMWRMLNRYRYKLSIVQGLRHAARRIKARRASWWSRQGHPE
jgi:hypothetical protein